MTLEFRVVDNAFAQLRFEPTRAAGLRRLEQFVPRAGRDYAQSRNYDFGPDRRGNVSTLSPWMRHRLLTEEEVLSCVLSAHGEKVVDKFIQEVLWRTYFKGWLEQRPSVWFSYQRNLVAQLERLEGDTSLNAAYRDAVSGRTGIACFDHWMRELSATGYLHNHVRMWVASIWIFTLRLPWELGADVFMRHLVDGDPASNTLSWRWVAGLHTKGKTYLARTDNIAKYTDGRFQPQGLANVAESLVEATDHPRFEIRPQSEKPLSKPYLLLVTEEDMSAADITSLRPAGVVGLLATDGRSPVQVGDLPLAFVKHAMNSALSPHGEIGQAKDDWSEPLIKAAQTNKVDTIVTPYCPIGPTRVRLDRAEPKLNEAGIYLHRIWRPYDAHAWPHAKAGFFGFKKKIPSILQALNLTC
ncbi:FAD-binding domain-containing protein [Ruegeria profundi]|uniref:FAD-binding domain-containing protein n=1 Tax=Ruegeria profundi TaxID=1685378 RepID=UPI003C7AA306